MIVTRDPDLAARMRSLRNQGRAPTDSWLQHTEIGYNYRLSEIACTLGIGQMQRLPSILNRREEIARIYRQHLSAENRLTLPIDEIPGCRISWFVYVVRLAIEFTAAHRDQVIRELEQAGIGCGRYFAPVHLQPAYADLPSAADLSVTESVATRTIALPFFNRINDSQIVTACEALKLAIRRIYLQTPDRSNNQWSRTRANMPFFFDERNIAARAARRLGLVVLSAAFLPMLRARQPSEGMEPFTSQQPRNGAGGPAVPRPRGDNVCRGRKGRSKPHPGQGE